MKVAFATLGCRTNQHDTAEMQVLLEKEGYSIVKSSETADVYVINTCTVTARSDYSSRLAVKKSLAINENATVVFTGCYAQLNPEDAANMEGLDIVLGNADKLKIAEILKEKIKTNSLQKRSGLAEIHMSDIYADREFKTLPITQLQGRTKAFIKVQTGCDENCSFCTVVRARGSSASDTRKNILDNVQHAINGGYKEITLTGINLGTWGMDFRLKETFSSLVRDIANLPGEFRVRLSSINPMEIDDHLIELIAQHEKICPHLHIPLQSGDTEILSKMRRNYDAEQYKHITQHATNRITPLGLGADVIVGFPGENEKSFECTRKLIEELPFSYLHVFSYSPRSGTEAYNFKNNIKNTIKKERNLILSNLVREKAHLFYKSFIGKKVTVLIEEPKVDGVLKGYSEHYIPVRIDTESSLKNQLVPVIIKDVQKNELVGCLES